MTVLEEATRYAERLAVAIHAKHYAGSAPQWKPLSGDLLGLLTQIDNMTAGMGRPCPFDGENPIDLEPEDPCPVCGMTGSFQDDNLDRCVSSVNRVRE
jgi:hypothetical protein